MHRLRFALIIPLHNAEDHLERCLGALKKSSRKPEQVLLVDDGSTDGSAELGESFDYDVLRSDDGPVGPAAARNRGAAAVDQSIDVLAFVDSDVEVHPDTFERLMAGLENDRQIAAAFGSYDDQPDDRGVGSIYANLRHHHVHQQADRRASTFWAGCGVVRRDAFEAVGGFDTDFGQPSIEDIDLGVRINEHVGAIRLVPEAQAKHLKRWTLTNLWRTDVQRRALPWSRLLVSRSDASFQLNADRTQQLSAMCVHLVWLGLVLGLVIHWGVLIVAGLALVGWLLLNRKLLALLARRGQAKGFLGGGLLHFIYHGYASVTFAAVVLGWRWSNMTWRGRWASRSIVVLITSGLCLAGVVGLGLWMMDTQALSNLMLGLQKDTSHPRFPPLRVLGLQHRALLAALGYFALAAAMVMMGPRPVQRVLGDGRVTARALGRIPTMHRLCLLVFTIGAGWLAANHLNQTMRFDEATSALNYAFHPMVVGLGFYQSTNNHILHSLFMRCSVLVFGRAEWAIRLPAYLAALACIPGLYLAGRRMVGSTTGLIAAGLAAGSIYQVDLATEARGYSLVNLAFVLILALLPSMYRRRPGAWVGLVLLAGLGAWAVPMMIYPFAIAVAWLVVYGLWHEPIGGRMRWLKDLIIAVFATGAMVGLLYSPALIVIGLERQGAHQVMASAQHPTLANRFEDLIRYTTNAWQQWTYPLTTWPALVSLALVIVGLVVMLRRGGRAGALAIALILGPAAVLLATSLAAPPWWALAFAFCLYLLLLAVPLASVIDSLAQRSLAGRSRYLAAAGLALALAAITSSANLTSNYPASFPNYVGYPNAPWAAAYLARQNLHHARIVTDNLMSSTVAFYLKRYELSADPHLFSDSDWHQFSRLYYITRKDQSNKEAITAIRQRADLERVHTLHLPRSRIITYHVHHAGTK